MRKKEQVRAGGEALLDIDHKVHEAVKQERKSTPVKAIGWLSEIGDQPQLRLLCGGLLLVGLVRADARMIGAAARMLLAHELATAAKSVIKHRVDRKRPRSASGKDEEEPHAGHRTSKEETSFPSGHSAGAMAVARAFAAVYPEHKAPALLTAGGVALAQIPRCAHYPTDVGAGLLVGVAAEGVAGLAWRVARMTTLRLARRLG